jgi:hypothetical protein
LATAEQTKELKHWRKLDSIAEFQPRLAAIAAGNFSPFAAAFRTAVDRRSPGNLQNDRPNDEVLAGLNGKRPFKRMSGFATSMWAILPFARLRR